MSHKKMSLPIWNSLEIAKLLIGALTPIAIAYFSFQLNDAQIRQKEYQEELNRNRDATILKQNAIGTLSHFIYDRRVRSELLLSAIKRHNLERTQESKDDLIYRKRLYDAAYAEWNSSHQANLLLVRQMLNVGDYSSFESAIEHGLSLRLFKPLDKCLTDAFNRTLLGEDQSGEIEKCRASELIQSSLDCGYAITDELFRLTWRMEYHATSGARLRDKCPQ
jgi:hypothetical protein